MLDINDNVIFRQRIEHSIHSGESKNELEPRNKKGYKTMDDQIHAALKRGIQNGFVFINDSRHRMILDSSIIQFLWIVTKHMFIHKNEARNYSSISKV